MKTGLDQNNSLRELLLTSVAEKDAAATDSFRDLHTEIISFLSQTGERDWRPKRPGMRIPITLEGETYQARLVPETDKRPNVMYLNYDGFNALYTSCSVEIYGEGTNLAALQDRAPLVGAFYYSKDGTKAMVLREYEGFSREMRIRWAAGIAHEFEHYKGGKEGAAYVRQNRFEVKNGITPSHPTMESMLGHIASEYTEDEYVTAVEELLELCTPSQIQELGRAVGLTSPSDVTTERLAKHFMSGPNQKELFNLLIDIFTNDKDFNTEIFSIFERFLKTQENNILIDFPIDISSKPPKV